MISISWLPGDLSLSEKWFDLISLNEVFINANQ